MTTWTQLEPPSVLVDDVARPFSISLVGDLEQAFREWLTESFGGHALLTDEDVARYRDAWGSGWSFRCDQLAREREAEPKSESFQVFVAPTCPICGEPTSPVYAWAYQEPVRWLCSKLHDDDLLPARRLRPTPADEVIGEWDRLGMSAEVAERLEAFFSGATPEQPPPPGGAETDARAAGGSAVASVPGARSDGGRAPGDLERCIRDAMTSTTQIGPMTAFEIAELVLSRNSRWAASSIRRKVGQLAERGVLRATTSFGRSPAGAPCKQYEVA